MDVDVPNSIGFKRAISINVFIRPITFQGWVVALGSKSTPKNSNCHIKGHTWGFCMGSNARFRNYEWGNQIWLRWNHGWSRWRRGKWNPMWHIWQGSFGVARWRTISIIKGNFVVKYKCYFSWKHVGVNEVHVDY